MNDPPARGEREGAVIEQRAPAGDGGGGERVVARGRDHMINTPQQILLYEALGATGIASAGLFDARAVGKLAAKCRNQPFIGFRDNMAFVGILSTQLWHRSFIEGFTARRATGHPQAAYA